MNELVYRRKYFVRVKFRDERKYVSLGKGIYIGARNRYKTRPGKDHVMLVKRDGKPRMIYFDSYFLQGNKLKIYRLNTSPEICDVSVGPLNEYFENTGLLKLLRLK